MASIREYLNAKIKEKGSTLAKEKAKAEKYKSIAAAKKAGALYYTDKNGKVQAAVYAEDLKKPIRPKAKPKDPRATRPKQPKGAPKKDNIITSVISDTKGGRGDTGAIKRIIGLAPGKKKPSKGSGRGDGAKETLQRQTDPKSPSRLRGAEVMKKIPRSKWASMSKSERRALGLPATRVAAMAGKLRDVKFKDGKGF